ncbi:MAG TPA: hypothetical protein VFA34_03815 [Actinomycetota bacterium]|nr:hypothetical protein [Actinomycetota bacterium]
MDDVDAQLIADYWSGGGGLVPRGPKAVLATRPVTPGEVERHTGRRPLLTESLWRIEVGGRFLRSGATVYPGGVPFPEELHSRTAVIANEVWLYVNDDGDVLGTYWWPEGVRRPIASTPKDEYAADQIVDPSVAAERFGIRLPGLPPWQPTIAVCWEDEALVFLTCGPTPDPLHEMLIFEQGGLSFGAWSEDKAPDVEEFANANSPPYRRLREPGRHAIGRDPGRALGPQTWPWPGELRWWQDGLAYELKGFVPLATLSEVAATVSS